MVSLVLVLVLVLGVTGKLRGPGGEGAWFCPLRQGKPGTFSGPCGPGMPGTLLVALWPPPCLGWLLRLCETGLRRWGCYLNVLPTSDFHLEPGGVVPCSSSALGDARRGRQQWRLAEGGLLEGCPRVSRRDVAVPLAWQALGSSCDRGLRRGTSRGHQTWDPRGAPKPCRGSGVCLAIRES